MSEGDFCHIGIGYQVVEVCVLLGGLLHRVFAKQFPEPVCMSGLIKYLRSHEGAINAEF